MTQQGRRTEHSEAVSINVSEAQLVTALDLIEDGLAVVDAAGVIVFVNRQLCEMFGYRSLDLVGQPIEMLVPTDRRRDHRVDRVRFTQTGGTRPMGRNDLDIEGRHATGRYFAVDVKLAPLPNGGLIAATVRNVAAERQAAADMAVQRMNLHAAMSQVAKLVAAHDLVLQELFALGSHLEAQVASGHPELRTRLSEAVTIVDEAIKSIRGASFE